MAQSVERRLGKAEVTGPIPVSSSQKSLICRDFSFCIAYFQNRHSSDLQNFVDNHQVYSDKSLSIQRYFPSPCTA